MKRQSNKEHNNLPWENLLREKPRNLFSIEKLLLFNERYTQTYGQSYSSPPSQVTQIDPALPEFQPCYNTNCPRILALQQLPQ